LALIFAFPTILLGVFDWIHFYNAALVTPIIIKIVLASIALIVLGIGIILGSEIKLHSFFMTVVYAITFVSMIGLGYFGAGIIYGRGMDKKIEKKVQPHPMPDKKNLGIEEKLSRYIALDANFTTENGEKKSLKELIKEPTILSIYYYNCHDACNYLLVSLASILKTYKSKKGEEPHLISITIDENEKVSDAVRIKNIAYESIQRPFPKENWAFLTGDEKNIKKVTDSVGFKFMRNKEGFDHPMGLIILSPDGKIVRYIMGTEFLPVDISMSLLEASKGVVKPTIARVLRFCFRYDPKSHQFVFNILQVSATVIFIFLGIFIVYLIVSFKKRKSKGIK